MKLYKIMKLIEKINRLDGREIFFEFAGHVDRFNVTIYNQKWSLDTNADFMGDYRNTPKEIKKAYNDILKNI